MYEHSNALINANGQNALASLENPCILYEKKTKNKKQQWGKMKSWWNGTILKKLPKKKKNLQSAGS